MEVKLMNQVELFCFSLSGKDICEALEIIHEDTKASVLFVI